MTEIWEWIPDYEGLYQVSSLGRIKSVAKTVPHRAGRRTIPECIKKQFPIGGDKNHLSVTLSKIGKIKTIEVHRLVMNAFKGKCPNGLEIRHLNGDGFDNNITNLRYGTRSENYEDSRRHGTAPIGSKHGSAKLTEMQVLNIRKTYKRRGDVTKLAKHYSVCPFTIYKIIQNQSWQHIGE